MGFGENDLLFKTPGLKGHKMIFSLFPKPLVYFNFEWPHEAFYPNFLVFNLRTRSILISLVIMLSPVAVYASTLPQPLSGSDVAHYKRLIELQKGWQYETGNSRNGSR